MTDQIAKHYTIEVTPEITKDLASSRFQEINVLLKANMVSSLNMEFKVSLHVLCDLISEMIKYDVALLYLWDNDREMMTPYIVRGLADELPDAFGQGNLFSDWAMAPGETFLVSESRHEEVSENLHRLHASSMVSVPIYANKNIIGNIQIFSRNKNFFTEDDAKLLWLLMIQSETFFRNIEGAEQVENLSQEGTVLLQANLSQFFEQLEREIGRAHRRKTPMSLLMIEIDRWQEYNDEFGHLIGEQTLNELTSLLMNQVRQIDTVCRYDESRFVMILTETDRKGGLVFAERLQDTVGRHLFLGTDWKRSENITISAGLVTYPFDAEERSTLVRSAEQALSRAKEAGGNRVAQYPAELSQPQKLDDKIGEVDYSRVTRTIHSISNTDHLLEMTVEIIMDTLMAEKGSLLVAENGTDQFVIRVACGFRKHGDLINNTRISGEGSVTGWVAGRQTPIAVANIEEVEDLRKNLYGDYNNNSFLSIPVIHDGRTIGVIHLSNEKDGAVFTSEHLDRLRPLTSHLPSLLREGLQFEKRQRRFSKNALASLAVMLDAKDPYCDRHSERVSHYAKELARRLEMSEEQIENLEFSARLHDIGKIAITNDLTNKAGKLSDDERAVMRRHPFLSWKILDGLSLDDAEVKNTVLQHHERLNGSGYPHGLVGDQIPLPARILSVADTFVAMTSKRPHRPPFSREQALREMATLANDHFDPEVLEKLSEIVD
jgi:diguanylate cyclase (GGDEF)-like protein